jgi:hypothetical protein
MVFILYAEDRGLLSNDPVYLNSYSVSGLFERLREDDAQYPDTMDQRFGAWAQFLTLCRLIYDGGGHGAMSLPPRHGRLFDPDVYPFLEGRPLRSKRDAATTITPPRISDGIVFRVLKGLLLLDGDRLSYRSLDVEQIGSVYQAMMGFEVQIANGTSIGLRPDHVVVNLTDLLAKSGSDRGKWLKEKAGCDLTGRTLDQLKSAATAEDLVAALGRRISPLYLDQRGMPTSVATGGIYLQPTEERRRSGSHYTPRSLTEPIVRTTLEPILKQLAEKPRPQQILDLKVCDPAMGSGAFLVEACRFLAEALVESWSVHGETPIIPPDQEPVLHARRLIAQRCLYGVDKNPFAVDLAKLSLWLATLAKDHPFTFLDHSLRCGDSLVGLTRLQIAAFCWIPAGQQSFLEQELRKRIERVSEFRQRILTARDEVPYEQLHQQLDRADDAVFSLRQAADAVIAAFFSADRPRAREEKRAELQSHVEAAFRQPGRPQHEEPIAAAVRSLAECRLSPFHWELEFPEVFARGTPGFDAIVGNPPFLGGSRISTLLGDRYLDWLSTHYTESRGKSDLVAYFFRQAFVLLSVNGTFGLIATNTISQGETRFTGLRWICTLGGTIYSARRRYPWPGLASVIVSVVHVIKGVAHTPLELDGRPAQLITAYLFHAGGHEDPFPLRINAGRSFHGPVVLGMGFTFDDSDTTGVANPIGEMHQLLQKNARNAERIHPYIGGEEINESPTHEPTRYVIDFGDLTEESARQWPDLMAIVERKVRPYRESLKRDAYRNRWWLFGERQPSLYAAIAGLQRVLVTARISKTFGFTFVSSNQVLNDKIVVFSFDSNAALAVLQSRVHETWARFLSSTLKDDLQYTPSACFETFPFPECLENLEAVGETYHGFRCTLMVGNNEGLTKTYNRFHNPDDTSVGIIRLRGLHAEMDQAVLDAYGWNDIQPACDFYPEFDDEDEENDGSRPRRRKYRYRWPDDARDEVLARLLELNRQRADEERSSGAAAEIAQSRKPAAKLAGKRKIADPTLFVAEDESK